MKKLSILLILITISINNIFSQEIKTNNPKPQIAVLDIISTSFDKNKIIFLTDSLQTELFKTKLFKILERGVIDKVIQEQKFQISGLVSDSDIIKIGKFLSVEKLFVCKIEKFGESLALNVKIIDVQTLLIEFTENVYIKSESNILDAIKEIVNKVTLYYNVLYEEQSTTEEKKDYINRRKWAIFGANDDDIEFLIKINAKPDDYLNLRQYDISFTIKEFINSLKQGIDLSVLQSFLQRGIPYELAYKAISLGIQKLDNYNQYFKPYGISFNEYLEAYQNKITTVDEYRNFKAGFKQDRLIVGLGGVSDETPIATAIHKFVLGVVGWEHFWTKYQRDFFKWSMTPGLYLFNLFVPIPYFQVNTYFGVYPIYSVIGIGFFYEVLLGDHFAGFLKLGFEVLESYEVTVSVVYGTQPKVSYADFKTRKGEAGYNEIKMPYIGITFVYKL